MKKLLFILLVTMISCADSNKQMQFLQQTYPQYKIMPAIGILQNNGFDFMMKDSLSGDIIAVKFYPFSEKKVSELRNVW